MAEPDLIGLFVAPLEATGIAYMITGGVASVIYGDPRFTRDVDIVMGLTRTEIPALASAFVRAVRLRPAPARRGHDAPHQRRDG